MANSIATGLKVLFTALGLAMVVTLAYTIAVDGSPFRREVLNPWLVTTLIDFYINVAILSAWVIYKESSWINAILWIILLACVGRPWLVVLFGAITSVLNVATCVYIVIQLFKLSPQESEQDPIYHVLLRHPNRNNAEQTTKHIPVGTGRVIVAVLGCLMLGILVYTTKTYWSLFVEDLTTPWATATAIDFTINAIAIGVWVAYKESSLVSAVLWIILLIILGSFVTCTYIVIHLSRLSAKDPFYLVLFRSSDRAEGKYERATF